MFFIEIWPNQGVSQLYQYFIKNNKTYLQKECLDLCIEEKVYKQCNFSNELGKPLTCENNTEALNCGILLYFED